MDTNVNKGVFSKVQLKCNSSILICCWEKLTRSIDLFDSKAEGGMTGAAPRRAFIAARTAFATLVVASIVLGC